MITGNEPINPVIWDSRHNPEFEVSSEGLTFKQHMVVEFTKSFTTSGSFRRMSLLSRILLFFGLQGYKVVIDYAFTENVKSAIELADEVIKQLNEKE